MNVKKWVVLQEILLLNKLKWLVVQMVVKSFDVTSSTTTTQVDLRLAHAVKALFFGAKNTAGTGQFRSNYATKTCQVLQVCK